MNSFLLFVVLIAMLVTGHNCKHSCKQLLLENPATPSGVYQLKAETGPIFEVYCEMGLNHGGYTFLSPSALSTLTDEDLFAMITDKTSVLLRVRKTSGTQPYATLRQLPEYASIPLKLGLNSFNDYSGPVNREILGKPYLLLGFLPIKYASSKSVQGIQVNGHRNTFQNCDGNPSSHITLFPNFKEIASSNYYAPGSFCDRIFSYLLPNPSGRVMPSDYFMFGELYFGGCGCYLQTSRIPDVLGLSIGFR